jgi:L-2-hydroxyglutarate oxidase LhgO
VIETDIDIIVVGAGVVGLAIARELALAGHSVIAIEKAAGAGTETSSRNSEVIHAGIYYPQGSLKARLCVEGRSLLYDFCASHGVEARRIGKLIAATSRAEEEKLHAIAALARANGVDDLQWLSASEAACLEPEVRCTRALFSPSTGIVDSSGYMLALQGDAEAHGASFAFRTECVSAKPQDGAFIVTARSEDGEETRIVSRRFINCAGHGAHAVASSVEGFNSALLPPKHFAKGSYCSLSGRAPFSHLVYPVPVPGALGIHATLDLAGAVRFGPDITWVETLDYSLSPQLPHMFAAAVSSYWPGVEAARLEPSYCGIRPKIHGPDKGSADFLIQHEAAHGIAGLVNLFGIESPGLTASLAIARHVAAAL